jgi:hypothetical protein
MKLKVIFFALALDEIDDISKMLFLCRLKGVR